MKRIRHWLFVAVVAVAILSTRSSGHDVITTPITFSREISRLFNERCVTCHHQGGMAFSLATYEEARPWAKAIEEEVLERRMPPWGAVKGFGDFKSDQGLTQEQLEVIADWAEGGAPEGDPQNLPKPPVLPAVRAEKPASGGVAVNGELTLKAALAVSGVQVRDAKDGASFMAVAERSDGTTEPLVWIYNYQAKFPRTYWYVAPLKLAAGTKIVISPAGSGGIALLTTAGRAN